MFFAHVYAIAPRAVPEIADALVRRSAEHVLRHRIDRPLRLAHWLGQMAHESAGFTRLEENLTYTATRLLAVFPARVTAAQASRLAGDPRAIANHVYGGRLGNTGHDDGWLFRGRGLIQLTGRANYERIRHEIGLDIVARPDLAAEPATAIAVACAWWRLAGCNEAADSGDVERVTRIINGGVNGLSDRKRLTERAYGALFPDGDPRNLRAGATGHDVALLQGELVELGMGGIPDGSYGAATAARVRAWQREQRLADDGIVGPATRAALARSLAAVRRDAL